MGIFDFLSLFESKGISPSESLIPEDEEALLKKRCNKVVTC